jgi:hypothetical protein
MVRDTFETRAAILSRCFDGHFFKAALLIPRWPAFCDEHLASLLSVGRATTERIEP